ncbi:hypothetical protein QQ73_17135, partial [Candidatus Endoriftia persephone str. Guaymas]|nr:hypothetical protein [Candidatus Endoriftia persephone str. Guaymas]
SNNPDTFVSSESTLVVDAKPTFKRPESGFVLPSRIPPGSVLLHIPRVIPLAEGLSVQGHQLGIFAVVLAVLYLLEATIEFLALLAQIASVEALAEDADLVLDNLGGAAQGAQAAGKRSRRRAP